MSEMLGGYQEQASSDPAEVLNTFEQSLSEPGRTEALVQERVGKLEEGDRSTEISAVGNNPYSGFIHPETRVVRNHMVDRFMVNDPEAYQHLVDSIRLLKETPGWSELGLRQISLPAVQHAIATYFGNFAASGTTENQNREFYMDHTTSDSDPINLTELKGKGFAVCVEKSALAQNFLTLLGYESKMIMSQCELGPETEEGHAFQLVTTDKGTFIYDPTNPSLTLNAEGEAIGQSPAVYPLTAEQITAFGNGGAVEVTHYDTYDKTNGETERRPSTRVYGGKNI